MRLPNWLGTLTTRKPVAAEPVKAAAPSVELPTKLKWTPRADGMWEVSGKDDYRALNLLAPGGPTIVIKDDRGLESTYQRDVNGVLNIGGESARSFVEEMKAQDQARRDRASSYDFE